MLFRVLQKIRHGLQWGLYCFKTSGILTCISSTTQHIRRLVVQGSVKLKLLAVAFATRIPKDMSSQLHGAVLFSKAVRCEITGCMSTDLNDTISSPPRPPSQVAMSLTFGMVALMAINLKPSVPKRRIALHTYQNNKLCSSGPSCGLEPPPKWPRDAHR